MINKNLMTVVVLIFASAFVFAQKKDVPQHKYVGAKTCGMCHRTAKQGEQLKIWENSKHAHAYKTLESKEADKIAKEKGFKTPAVKTPECLECHAPQYNVDAKYLEKKFNIEDGVQCETCHGPGSDYKNFSVMKNQKKAVAAGLVIHTDMEKFCVTCHNEKNPTMKKGEKVDVKALWAKIKHDIPKK